eukprot:47867-Eustigmatos_ZCMA.PRE.1
MVDVSVYVTGITRIHVERGCWLGPIVQPTQWVPEEQLSDAHDSTHLSTTYFMGVPADVPCPFP